MGLGVYVLIDMCLWVRSIRTHARQCGAGGARRAQAGRGGNRTSRPCRAVACLSLPEVNNVFFHLALESKEIIL